MKQLSTILLALTLALIPLAVWAEHVADKTWHNRLAVPELIEEPSRHTPMQTEGTFLPPTIEDTYELTTNQNPVILTQQTVIKPKASLVIKAGTMIYAHEFAQLTVVGTLMVEGTKAQPVIFMTNEQHPLNQTWNGIVAANGSAVKINYAVIQDASPALSCLDASRTTAENVIIERGSMGVWQTSQNCIIKDSLINGSRDGVVAVKVKPQLVQTKVIAKREQVKIIEEK